MVVKLRVSGGTLLARACTSSINRVTKASWFSKLVTTRSSNESGSSERLQGNEALMPTVSAFRPSQNEGNEVILLRCSVLRGADTRLPHSWAGMNCGWTGWWSGSRMTCTLPGDAR